jgi:hypothetical protein
MKSKTTIRKHLRELRALIDAPYQDPILVRISYEMETAVIWATEKTVKWPGLAEQAKTAAILLKKELYKK